MPSSTGFVQAPRPLQYFDVSSKDLLAGGYNLTSIRKVGSGYSSNVTKATWSTGSKGDVAVKAVFKSKTSRRMVTREIELLRRCQDKNIVRFDQAVECRDTYVIITEYCSMGDLFSNLKNVNDALVREYMTGIVRGLESLHRRLVAHCDIKMKNILITDNNVIKIADFGFAVQLHTPYDTIDELNGTEDYWGPEMSRTSPSFSPLVADIYALGVTFVGMFERRAIKKKSDNIHHIVTGYRDIHQRRLLQGMLAHYPQIRWTVSQVKHCEWFQDMSPPPSPT